MNKYNPPKEINLLLSLISWTSIFHSLPEVPVYLNGLLCITRHAHSTKKLLSTCAHVLRTRLTFLFTSAILQPAQYSTDVFQTKRDICDSTQNQQKWWFDGYFLFATALHWDCERGRWQGLYILLNLHIIFIAEPCASVLINIKLRHACQLVTRIHLWAGHTRWYIWFNSAHSTNYQLKLS